MKPFFSYYGSKMLLAAADFYPAPAGVVCEPFAGSACYSVYHNHPDVILIDACPDVVNLWKFLINATAKDIRDMPTDLNDEIFGALSYEYKNLISRWVNKGRAGMNVNKLGSWYHKHKHDNCCSVWGAPVKERIIRQLPLIKNWDVHLGDYSVAPAAHTYFIDPPYSGECGKKYKKNNIKINWNNYLNWIIERSTSATCIVCENGARTIDFSMIGEDRNIQEFKIYSGKSKKLRGEISLVVN